MSTTIMILNLKLQCTILFLFSTIILSNGETAAKEEDQNTTVNTDVAHEKDKRLLLFATLNGMLTAVEQQTGKVQWKIKNSPMVQVPLISTNTMVPIFLPDPRDGSLYLLDNTTEPLKKLPFTIPQLVSSSPCKSSDGILYTGKKKDTWFKLDPVTGNKQQILGWGNQSATCSINPEGFIYIGRAKYNIKMIDSKKPENKWNITFYDYSASPMNKEDLRNYNLAHFTSTSNGTVLTFDRRRSSLLWQSDLDSPVIRIYVLDSEGLTSVPFISMANYTLTYLLTQLLTNNGHLQNLNQMRLYPALYIGEHMYGLYATTSLVGQNDITLISSSGGPLLLGGPQELEKPIIYPAYPLPGYNYLLSKDFTHEDFQNFQSLPKFEKHMIFPGPYNFPQFGDYLIEPIKTVKQITDESSSDMLVRKILKGQKHSVHRGVQTEFMPKYTFHMNGTKGFVIFLYHNVASWVNQQENVFKLALISLMGLVIAMFWYMQIQMHRHSVTENNSNADQLQVSHSGSFLEDLSNGYIRIGKISFHPEKLLGKGCEGTFVYRGEFDKRQVAVKRLLPECFTFADREVTLLRESDAHPHVIRYYCMEQDRMFRYIALELCQATLFDYVEGKYNISNIMPLEILRQATLGLEHLHSLDIVHRDIKPHNVLLSMPNNRGEVRAMISDFGLCKKLQVGKISFSRRSGITGTDGWIAPEMLNGNKRTTYAVDLFSLGCLFYYVLSNGYHPFGDSLRCQANILKGDYNLAKLKGAEWEVNVQKPLLSALIHSNPEHRPSCKAVLQHPIFWNVSKILSFLQDVSDRVEKSFVSDFVLRALEKNREQVVRTNWMRHIHEELIYDLKKYRSYQGNSIRDLLRALRNKKHHYQELSQEAQTILGDMPDAFTHYWSLRFPLLLVHTWITMQCLAAEKVFRDYYHETHRYSIDYYGEYRKIVSVSSHIDTTMQCKEEENDCTDQSLVLPERRKSKEKYKRGPKKKFHKEPKKIDEPIVWLTKT